MAYTAKVFYCSGGTVSDFLTVTMTEENCPFIGTIYDDGYGCVYETHRKNLMFSLSKAVDFGIRLRFPVYWEQDNDGTISSGNQIHQIDIPAGLTNYTWQQFMGEEWRCKETRTCYEQTESAIFPSQA